LLFSYNARYNATTIIRNFSRWKEKE